MTDKTDREIMQMALDALEVVTDTYDDNAAGIEIDAIIALRKRLAQPEKEPVAYVIRTLSSKSISDEIAPTQWSTFESKIKKLRADPWVQNGIAEIIPLYTAPQQRKPLTDEEKLIDLLEAARETFKKSPSGSECSQNAAYVHSVLETMLIKREWKRLTDEEISEINKSIPGGTEVNLAKRLFAREIEDKLKEKNT